MMPSNTSSFKIVQKKKKKKIGEFRLYHRKELLVYTDFETNKVINKGGVSDFFRLLKLYREAEQYDTIEHLDILTQRTEELFDSGKITL